ncbi:baseplate megatron protein TIM-barrel domain-containing protein [Rhodomicrobium lacus]|uniref:baseplate megatron protein TIM-barrel domain-containing protein n=1 Tax=Rhodomicrobium lacus TaxID=2498452 RepID=UPI000F8E58B0|nr:glycoside hydrolase TIM-barrel-like domain-containing protein [Rhodomicrobium lacus]
MTGKDNLFSPFGFSVDRKGRVDNNTRAFLSKFKGRTGPAIADLESDASWTGIAATANALIREFVAQGWTEKGFDSNETAYASAVRAVTMIPAATEFAYAPYEVLRDQVTAGTEYVATENAFSIYERDMWLLAHAAANRAGRIGGAACDWATSLNVMQSQLPNVGLVNLFVSWYGTDLRAGECILVPGVTRASFETMPDRWSCAGMSRGEAHVVSQVDGNAAFGGTPDDTSLVACIKDLKARKLEVAFTPFILMDIPAGNALPDPLRGGAGQPVYPWRGRITKAYATADRSAEVEAEVAAFVRQYRAFVLHYAQLCADAGGVDIFLLGTELRGLTWLRGAEGGYPFVTALKQLAADVKAVLPRARLSYAADWSEWFGHQPPDGTGDAIFHLDPLWTDPNIDAIAFDNYWPLSDWRDGTPNMDRALKEDGTLTANTDYDYLMGNIRGGEGYDWYYASTADRDAQVRSPITDGGYHKPWIYRYKDIWGWWANPHYDRLGGIEAAEPTAWVPRSKPFWFTELGCPSIDKGSNQPNVFHDPKSAESALPHHSTGQPDNLIQRRYLHSMLRFFDETDAAFEETNNPQSTVYDGRMVDVSRIMIYTWDARPYPYFPLFWWVWSDAANWAYGHWIAGKLSTYALPTELDSMAKTTTYAPRHPYIVDPATGKLDKQYADFFQSIEFVKGSAIANVPLEPTVSEAAAAINSLLAVLRAQNRLAT